ncbi:MAG: ATP-binding cassette domain-containing protein [Terrimicrobiaceae bacterium]
MSSQVSPTSTLAPIALRDGLVLGRGADAGSILPDASVSRRHAVLRRTESGWRVEDLGSRSGSFLNGRLFKAEELVFGDLLRIGPFSLRFDGRFLQETSGTTGARLDARELEKSASGVPILSGVSLSVAPCQFVGVIGPSGAGKSTLLDALCALRPADSGYVMIDGADLYANYEALREELGYVPQDDIVPLELSIEQALYFSARLRLPRGTPAGELRKLVWHTMRLLGLEERAKTPVGKLSGGQRKRVSVGAELLCRPRLMFLDEPTSGLDPAAEFRLMESLRHLAATGCTILCTTHVMDNAFLFDRLAVLYGGRMVFFGEPAGALEYFDAERLTLLYDSLSSRPAADWPAHREDPPPLDTARALPQRRKRSAALPILLMRQWAILRADWKNLLLVLGQPAFIGLLVTWVSKEPALVLFFAYIATLWFGCGNAAQEIVKELPMFRRERLIGLGRHGYLLAKFLSLARITIVQSLLLYGVMQLSTWGIGGAVEWQIPGLILAACAAVGIGLAISAWAKSVLQAVMVVPLVLIPQILFSGFVPPAGDMKAGPYLVSRVMPSAAVQSVMDTSLFWQRKISGSMRVDYPSAFSNLNRDRSLKNGQIYANATPAWWGLGTLAAWAAGAYWAAWFALRGKERG